MNKNAWIISCNKVFFRSVVDRFFSKGSERCISQPPPRKKRHVPAQLHHIKIRSYVSLHKLVCHLLLSERSINNSYWGTLLSRVFFIFFLTSFVSNRTMYSENYSFTKSRPKFKLVEPFSFPWTRTPVVILTFSIKVMYKVNYKTSNKNAQNSPQNFASCIITSSVRNQHPSFQKTKSLQT